LLSFIESSPNDPFPRYGLALEYKNSGKLEDAARSFSELIERFPDYTPAYLHAGTVLAAMGRRQDAARTFRAGVEACTRKRDFHAKGEIEAALAELESAD
jgi:tetratricopeptide (TPR) repeat protein